MAITITKPTVGGNEDTWGSTINTALDTIIDAVNGTTGTTAPNLSTLTINGTDVTSTAAELNKLDGFTGTFEDLNYAKDLRATGVTSAEFDFLDGVTSNIQTQLDAKGTGSMTSFQLEDGDGTEVTVSNGKEVKFVEGVGININWTDTSTGSDGDPYDMTFELKGDQRLAAATDVYVGNSHEHIHFNDGNQRMEFHIGGVEDMRLTSAGDLELEGSINSNSATISSDINLKQNVQKVSGIEKVMQLNGVTFDWKKDGSSSAGVIAQDVLKVLPVAVKEKTDLKTNKQFLTVDYNALISILIEAIKELKGEIDELKNASSTS